MYLVFAGSFIYSSLVLLINRKLDNKYNFGMIVVYYVLSCCFILNNMNLIKLFIVGLLSSIMVCYIIKSDKKKGILYLPMLAFLLSFDVDLFGTMSSFIPGAIILILIGLIAYLSINVGFINILPFPAFDGGHVLFLIIEKIFRKPVDAKIENTCHLIGFILLLILMLVVTCSDIIKLF